MGTTGVEGISMAVLFSQENASFEGTLGNIRSRLVYEVKLKVVKHVGRMRFEQRIRG